MYYYVSGELIKTDGSCAIIDNHGIGYSLSVSANTLRALDGNNQVKLYTYFSVREDAQELFGFYTEEELSSFRLLITVSGVGPKAALAILSVLSPSQLASAVAASDTKSIAAAQGVGKKIAERVVLELKDKLAKEFSQQEAEPLAVMDPTNAADNRSEAINALVVLGYSRGEAIRAVREIDTDGMEIDDIIRAALKRMM